MTSIIPIYLIHLIVFHKLSHDEIKFLESKSKLKEKYLCIYTHIYFHQIKEIYEIYQQWKQQR